MLLIIDGHAYAYRAFHAIRSLNSPSGQPTNAIFGFVKMTERMIQSLEPTHVLVAWDGGLAPERTGLHPEYKAQRPPTPDALAIQLPQIQHWVDLKGLAQIERDDIEADDWIATYTLRARDQGWKVVIASADKDFLQLVSSDVGILNPNDKTGRVWTAEDVVAKTGVEPHQIVDWLTLIGDSVDNIPGVPGVGTKTATQLLRQFGSLEAVYQQIDAITSIRTRTSLEHSKEQVRRNQELIRLRANISDGPTLDALTIRAFQREPLAAFYKERGFRSLHAQIAPLEDSYPSALSQPDLL